MSFAIMKLVMKLSNRMWNYLHNTNIYLFQRKDMFRFNTDTFLLGEFMSIKPGETVLDIGTNNGALLLYASLQQPASLIGIDIFEEACELARSNLLHQGILNFDIQCIALQHFVCDPVDVIVCNPPYFAIDEMSNVNQNEFLRVARHEIRLTLEELGHHVSRLLKDGGRLYLVHRSSRLVDLIKTMDANQLGIQKITFVHDENKNDGTAVLIEAFKGYAHNIKVQKPIILQRTKSEET